VERDNVGPFQIAEQIEVRRFSLQLPSPRACK
jgi:hypothetical protein